MDINFGNELSLKGICKILVVNHLLCLIGANDRRHYVRMAWLLPCYYKINFQSKVDGKFVKAPMTGGHCLPLFNVHTLKVVCQTPGRIAAVGIYLYLLGPLFPEFGSPPRQKRWRATFCWRGVEISSRQNVSVSQVQTRVFHLKVLQCWVHLST